MLKVKNGKNVFHVNSNQKKVRVANLLSDKVDFKSKTVTRDKEDHYIRIKKQFTKKIKKKCTYTNYYSS